MTVQHCYALFYDDEFNEPQAVYVGTTARPVEERFQEHIKGILDLSTTKDLYHYARKRNLTNSLYVVLLESRDDKDGITLNWEHFWVEEFIKLGHPLQNSKHGNRRLTRKHDDGGFKAANAKAAERTKPLCVEWSKEAGFQVVAKHAPKLNALSKAEALRASIRGDHPSVEDLTNAEWVQRDKRRDAFVWGHFQISRKKTAAGFEIRVFDTKKHQDLTIDMTGSLDAAYRAVVKNWDNPTSWWKREATGL